MTNDERNDLILDAIATRVKDADRSIELATADRAYLFGLVTMITGLAETAAGRKEDDLRT